MGGGQQRVVAGCALHTTVAVVASTAAAVLATGFIAAVTTIARAAAATLYTAKRTPVIAVVGRVPVPSVHRRHPGDLDGWHRHVAGSGLVDRLARERGLGIHWWAGLSAHRRVPSVDGGV